MNNFKLSIPTPAVTQVNAEELLKLDILEVLKKPQESIYAVMDSCQILIKNRGLDKSLLMILFKDHSVLYISRSIGLKPIIKIQQLEAGQDA